MNKIYTLKTCNDCAKMLKEVKPTKEVTVIDIKSNLIDPADLDYAAEQLGSYAVLFSKKAVKYRELKLHEKQLTEKQMRKLILEEPTFLLRPLSIINGKVTIGKTKEAYENLKCNIHEK